MVCERIAVEQLTENRLNEAKIVGAGTAVAGSTSQSEVVTISRTSRPFARPELRNRYDAHQPAVGIFGPDIVILAAIAENGVIGRGNTLPWRLKSDMAHFRALTMGKPLIMGRKTFLSIGKPLKGRTTIVVSRDREFMATGSVVAPSIDAALMIARGDALRRGADTIVVAGGADIYAQALPLASRLVITRVHRRLEGDTLFPAIDPNTWRETARAEHAPEDGDDGAFAFVTYQRQTSAARLPTTEGRSPAER